MKSLKKIFEDVTIKTPDENNEFEVIIDNIIKTANTLKMEDSNFRNQHYSILLKKIKELRNYI